MNKYKENIAPITRNESTILNEYTDILALSLETLFLAYQDRLLNNPTGKHTHITAAKFCELLHSGRDIGSAFGAPLPILGPTVCAIACETSVILYAFYLEMCDIRNNKKLDNALSILTFLGKDPQNMIKEISKEFINDRREVLLNIEDTRNNEMAVANYLAVNIMATIKHNKDIHFDPAKQRSKKIKSHLLETKDHQKISLECIANFTLFKSEVFHHRKIGAVTTAENIPVLAA
jgi:hypothetical protein